MTTVSGEPLSSPNESSDVAQLETLTVRGEAHQLTASEQVRGIISRLSNLLSTDALVGHADEVPIPKWNDELGRLRVWAANVGANQTAQSSLEYRLRDDSHIMRRVIDNVSGLDRLLLDLEKFLEAADMEATGSDGDETLQSTYEPDEDLQTETEIQEIHGSVAHIVSNLYQLSMIIRTPSHHDRLLSRHENSDLHLKSWAKRHISQKYPLLPEFLAERISTTMSKQKAILKYREKQHNNPSSGHRLRAALDNTSYDELYETDSSSGESPTSRTHSSSFEEGSLKVTEPPKESAGQRPFECPYCFYIIVIRDPQDWTRHILHDLMPYVCTYQTCSTPNRLYDSRRQWYHHICTDHGIGRSTDNYFTCIVCGKDEIPAGSFERHLGYHLEDLALIMADPRNYQSDGDNEDEAASIPPSNEPVLQPLPWELSSGYPHHNWSIWPAVNQEWVSSFSSPLEPDLRWPSNLYASSVALSIESRQLAYPGILSSAGELGTYGDNSHIQQPQAPFGTPLPRSRHFHDGSLGLAGDHSSLQPTNSLPSGFRPPEPSLKCKWEGCAYSGVFQREADLIRHVRNIHISPAMYQCTEPNCNRKFSRKDHLSEHVRSMHTSQPEAAI